MLKQLMDALVRRLLSSPRAMLDQSRTINLTVHQQFNFQMPPAFDHRQLALSNEEAN